MNHRPVKSSGRIGPMKGAFAVKECLFLALPQHSRRGGRRATTTQPDEWGFTGVGRRLFAAHGVAPSQNAGVEIAVLRGCDAAAWACRRPLREGYALAMAMSRVPGNADRHVSIAIGERVPSTTQQSSALSTVSSIPIDHVSSQPQSDTGCISTLQSISFGSDPNAGISSKFRRLMIGFRMFGNGDPATRRMRLDQLDGVHRFFEAAFDASLPIVGPGIRAVDRYVDAEKTSLHPFDRLPILEQNVMGRESGADAMAATMVQDLREVDTAVACEVEGVGDLTGQVASGQRRQRRGASEDSDRVARGLVAEAGAELQEPNAVASSRSDNQ